jgi:hypothetical protein
MAEVRRRSAKRCKSVFPLRPRRVPALQHPYGLPAKSLSLHRVQTYRMPAAAQPDQRADRNGNRHSLRPLAGGTGSTCEPTGTGYGSSCRLVAPALVLSAPRVAAPLAALARASRALPLSAPVCPCDAVPAPPIRGSDGTIFLLTEPSGPGSPAGPNPSVRFERSRKPLQWPYRHGPSPP